ncbi:MAG: hypothetical protein AAF561_11895 [Planctomycetota bacterium]
MIAALPLSVRKSLRLILNVYPPLALLVAAMIMASGCSSDSDAARPTTETARALPNFGEDEVELSAQLASAKALPLFPESLEVVGHAAARAKVMHGKNRIEVINLGNTAWPAGTRIWVNGRYGATLPAMEPGKFHGLDFVAFRDADAFGLPNDNNVVKVQRIELETMGELTNVRFDLGY